VQLLYSQLLYLQSLSYNHTRKFISIIAQSEKASKRSGVPTLIRKIYKKCGGDDGVPLALIKKKYEQCGDGGVPPPEFMNSSGEGSGEGGVEGVSEGVGEGGDKGGEGVGEG